MVKFLLNETLDPIYHETEGLMSVGEFLEDLKRTLRNEEYEHIDAFNNVVEELNRGTRIAFVDGYETRLGAQQTVRGDSLIFTQGKGDQGL